MDLIHDFKDPGREYSVLAFWFLNGELEKERLTRQIDQMVEKGVYGGFMHPRAYLKTPYLEKEWWDAIGACVDEARKQGFAPWLYDEYAWPSGTAGSTFEYGYQKPSRILSEGRDNMAKGLYAVKKEQGSDISCRKTGNREDRLLYRAEKNGAVYEFYEKVFEKAVDYLNPETIACFIELTHEEYRRRWGEDFGSLIPGIFFDEIYMMGNPLPWTGRLPDRFRQRYGYDILPELPSLIEGTTDRDKQVRRDYFTLTAAMYEEAFFKQISDWCRRYHLKLTGHTEEFLWEHPRRQGDYFKTMRHLMVPGSDCHDYRYRYPRRITYCEPKYSVSVARLYGKERAMSEALGGAGWNCSMEEFKRGINTLAAMGTNMFILHGFYYECEHQGSQSDWPTSFFYQNPYWDYFKIFADYVRRLSFMNSQGNPVVDFGILYPIGDMDENMEDGRENAAGKAISDGFHQALNTMIGHQLDTDMVDEQSVLNAKIREGRLCIGQQRFKVLLLAEGGRLEEETKHRLGEWIREGGNVLYYQTGTAAGQAGAHPVMELSGKAALPLRQLPTAGAALALPSASIVYGNRSGIVMNHRKTDKLDYYLIVNNSDERRDPVLNFCHASVPVLLDIEKGLVRKADYKTINKSVRVSLKLEPGQAVYVLFGPEPNDVLAEDVLAEDNRPAPNPVQSKEEWITGKWGFLPLPQANRQISGKMGLYSGKTTMLDIPIAEFTSDLCRETETIRICGSSREQGACSRHLSLWNGRWITRRRSWNDQLDASDLYFRKTVFLDQAPDTAEFCVAAVDTFEFYINGKLVYEGTSSTKPVVFTANGLLKEGENLLAVHVTNHNPLRDVYVCSAEELPEDRFISLLLEGKISTGQKAMTVRSDCTWAVNDSREDGWEQPDPLLRFAAVDFDVQKVCNFNYTGLEHVWIYAWERGRPPLKPWGDLPLFGQLLSYPRKLYYTVTVPAGASAVCEPVTEGAVSCLLDGREVQWENGIFELPGHDRIHILTIRITAGSGSDGLKQPVRVVMETVKTNLQDWRMLGLPWFSGKCRYTNAWYIGHPEGTYMLDLGRTNHCAEIWINGCLADIRLWQPYKADITRYIREGENEISIVVSNLAGNERRHMLVDEGKALGWNRYWNEDNMDRDSQNYVSGLLGPVRLINTVCETP